VAVKRPDEGATLTIDCYVNARDSSEELPLIRRLLPFTREKEALVDRSKQII
jgi:hypothetical protein